MRWSGVIDLVESGTVGGRAARLGAVMAELEAIADRSRSPLLVAEITCARPLLAAAGTRRPSSRPPWPGPRRSSVPPRQDPLLVRPVAAETAPKRRLTGAAPVRRRPLRRARSDPVGQEGAAGAADHRARRSDAGRRISRPSDGTGAADRAAGRRGAVEPRDRGAPVPLPSHRRLAPLPDLPQARRHRARQLRDALTGSPAG